MPKRIPEAEFESIRAAVGRFPEGVAIDDIARALKKPVPRRTLQRRLARLVERNELVLEGRKRGSRYRLPSSSTILEIREDESNRLEVHGEVYVPVSSEGEEIRQAVRLPVQSRKPVGYNRDFMAVYQPNQTFYLPAKIRRHLREIGGAQIHDLPAGTYAAQIYNRLLIDLTWNSSRLEGNTYSLLETERLLAAGHAAEGKDTFETQMILNHKAAIELLVEAASEVGFNSYTICNLHALLADNLLPDPGACGRLREQPVGIGGSVFHPLAGGPLLRECFVEVLQKVDAITDPFEQAFFAMVHLPYLQPFDDVNKRTSRLSANIPFIRENLSPLSFVDVPEKAYTDGLLGVYELNQIALLRDVFVWAYERSCARYSAVRQSLGEPDKFRLRYRDTIASLVADIVNTRMNKISATAAIKKHAASEVDAADQARFIEVTETELMSLHEGNMARYRIRPSEFSEWQQHWSED